MQTMFCLTGFRAVLAGHSLHAGIWILARNLSLSHLTADRAKAEFGYIHITER
jgi:hypothetical protein